MDPEKFQKIFYVAIIFLLLFLTFTIFYVHKEREMFLNDPAIYGLNERFRGNDFECFCSYELKKGVNEIIGFNNTHAYYLQKNYPFTENKQ